MGEREPFIVHCGKCGHEWAPCFVPVPIDVFTTIAKRPCPACGSRKVFGGPVPRETAPGDAKAWLSNGDTGISSLTIWSVMMRRTPPGHPHWYPEVPHDPDDFGRCYRLLKVMPAWRPRLGEVAARHPRWKPLVDVWDELSTLYEQELPTGTAPRLYARMQALLRGDEP